MKSPSKLLSEQRVAFFGTERRTDRSPHADCQNRGTTRSFHKPFNSGGAGLVLLGGVLQGLFAVPMKFVQRWKYRSRGAESRDSGILGAGRTFSIHRLRSENKCTVSGSAEATR